MRGFFCEVNEILDDKDYLSLAVQAARKGTETWTNPQVGAVIVKHDQILAIGYHHRFGGPHAEIDALHKLKSVDEVHGATMFITLEPCSHSGKTPPCAKKIVEVGITRVVVGRLDPNPLVHGKGVAILRKHGVSVDIVEQSELINQHYDFFYQSGRPFVCLKQAITLDGKINFKTRHRSRITGPEVFEDSQRLRKCYQAILVGEHTLRIDNPQLTVRSSPVFPPIRIVLVRNANELSENLAIFKTSAPVWLLSQTAPNKRFAPHVKVFTKISWQPKDILQLLTTQNIQSLLVEGGSAVHAAFTAAHYCDEVVSYVAPLLFGGQALPASLGTATEKPQHMVISSITQLGKDVKIVAKGGV